MRISSLYRKMNAVALINELGSVAAAMENNPAFKNGVPQGVSSAAALLTAREKVRFTHEAASTHDSVKIKERKAAEGEAVKHLDSVAAFYQLAAVSDPNVLLYTGFTPAPTRKGEPLLSMPQGLAIYQGPVLGSAAVTVNHLQGVMLWELQVAEGDLSLERNWRPHIFTVGDPMIINGLTVEREHGFRVRGYNRAGAGPWSPPVTFTPK
ncbi:fibronectin type III domain-containing protein [Geomonas oryzisoli]|uniref:Fibronectin type III domain-containing protein n=1 Tax=Geomonas oryzisoli TaxID=2847992 RepID=A0ABX8JBF5_9BACT|nr:fibronectin type III domain-containing protein [Geomonas oryzisoli]QWV94411.1 fibronectin type III domain-containing protein [Geomonas oryzisoli]